MTAGAATRPLFIDSSALVRRYLHTAGRELVVRAMDDHDAWCASILGRTETQLALRLVAAGPAAQNRLATRLREEWDAFWVVPLDARCLSRAAELGARFGLRTIDALHLASADRLPRPAGFLTFDRRQIPAAAGLGFEVISPLAD